MFLTVKHTAKLCQYQHTCNICVGTPPPNQFDENKMKAMVTKKSRVYLYYLKGDSLPIVAQNRCMIDKLFITVCFAMYHLYCSLAGTHPSMLNLTGVWWYEYGNSQGGEVQFQYLKSWKHTYTHRVLSTISWRLQH